VTTSGARRAPSAAGAALILIALLGLGTSAATAFPALTFEERLELAEDVFVGRVTALDAEAREGEPWTLVTLEVETWLLHEGRPTDVGPLQVTLAFLGGQAPGVPTRVVAGFPSFAVGDRMLVASYGALEGAASPLVGVTQGLWRDEADVWRDGAGQALALDAAGRPHLADDGDPESLWLSALAEHLRELRGEP
jgi:hypothetical protein